MTDSHSETLRTYANILEQPRRYDHGGPLYPPPEINVAAAKALRLQADRMESGPFFECPDCGGDLAADGHKPGCGS